MAGNALSFWALGLRPACWSAGAFNQTADNVLPMPLLEPPVEFGGVESHSMAAVVPSPSPIDGSKLLVGFSYTSGSGVKLGQRVPGIVGCLCS